MELKKSEAAGAAGEDRRAEALTSIATSIAYSADLDSVLSVALDATLKALDPRGGRHLPLRRPGRGAQGHEASPRPASGLPRCRGALPEGGGDRRPLRRGARAAGRARPLRHAGGPRGHATAGPRVLRLRPPLRPGARRGPHARGRLCPAGVQRRGVAAPRGRGRDARRGHRERAAPGPGPEAPGAGEVPLGSGPRHPRRPGHGGRPQHHGPGGGGPCRGRRGGGPHGGRAVPGDERLLHLLVLNLVENAVKFTPRGGEVEVALESAGHAAVLAVTDNGIGIPEEHHGRIFHKFFTVEAGASRAHGGAGIGLYLAKEVVAIHEGSIRVQGRTSGGTRFEVRLPLRPVS